MNMRKLLSFGVAIPFALSAKDILNSVETTYTLVCHFPQTGSKYPYCSCFYGTQEEIKKMLFDHVSFRKNEYFKFFIFKDYEVEHIHKASLCLTDNKTSDILFQYCKGNIYDFSEKSITSVLDVSFQSLNKIV